MTGDAGSQAAGPKEVVRIAAPAKVNLFLEVLGRMPDGYHELETLLLAIDLCDVVTLRRTPEPGVRLVLSGPHASADIPSDESNLVLQALLAELAEAPPAEIRGLGLKTGLDVELEKNVPSGAGLGGGSSDAVAALVALDRLLARRPDPDRRERRLRGLGADCVFFETASTTGFGLGKGRGDVVRPLPLRDSAWSLVVVVPDVRCGTASVYGALPALLSADPRAPSLALEQLDGQAESVRRELFNRLEEAALRIHPQLASWTTLFAECGAEHMRMTGSGSAFFGVFRDPDEANTLCERLCAGADARGLEARGVFHTRPFRAGWRELDA